MITTYSHMPLPYTVFTFSSHVSVDRYFRLRNNLFYYVISESRDREFNIFFRSTQVRVRRFPMQKFEQKVEHRVQSILELLR